MAPVNAAAAPEVRTLFAESLYILYMTICFTDSTRSTGHEEEGQRARGAPGIVAALGPGASHGRAAGVVRPYIQVRRLVFVCALILPST